MQRLDVQPRITMPLQTLAGGFTAVMSARTTYYTERLEAPPATFVLQPGRGLGRYSASADLIWSLPTLERIYETPGGLLGDRLKHTVEPEIAFHYTDGARNFQDIIQFDERDILSDTRELDYSNTNRLYSRGKSATAHEWLSWSLRQKYFFDPTFGGAFVAGQRNVFLTTALLSPFDFAVLPQHLSPISSSVRVSPFSGFDGDWRIDYDPQHDRVAGSAFTGHIQYRNVFFDGSHFLLRTPFALQATTPGTSTSFNQLRFSIGYGNAERQGLSAGVGSSYDVRLHLLQYASLQTTYNWDCCGISILYRRFQLGNPEAAATISNAFLRKENQFRATFSLANVGNFGNLKRQERIIY
jgi:LPS-assembly protein